MYEHSENTNLKKEKKDNEPLFTCGIYSYSVISVFQKIFSKIEPGSMKPLRYISNAFGFINNLKMWYVSVTIPQNLFRLSSSNECGKNCSAG